MATAKVIPLSAQAATGMARQHAMPLCTVLTPELATKLETINAMSRRLRAADVRIDSTSPLELQILINAEDSDQFAAAFSKEWRGASWSTKGDRTTNSVRLGGCLVCWYTPVKEQRP